MPEGGVLSKDWPGAFQRSIIGTDVALLTSKKDLISARTPMALEMTQHLYAHKALYRGRALPHLRTYVLRLHRVNPRSRLHTEANG